MFKYFKFILFLFLLVLLFIPFLGQTPLFDWFETGYAGASRQMVVSGDYMTIQLGAKPYLGFQPLFIWMQAISMKIFGINEFAARFPNAVCGIFTLALIFYIGRRLVSAQFGYLWALFYASSLVPFHFFRLGLIDPWYNFFILIGLFCLYKFFLVPNKKQKDLFIVLSALFLGLAVLVNGFWIVIILTLSLVFYFIIKMFKVKIAFRHILIFIIIFLIISCIWYFIEIIRGNSGYAIAALKFQLHRVTAMNTGRNGFFLIYLLITLLGVFPASIIAISVIRKQRKDDREPLHEFRNWMMILFLVITGFQLLMQPRVTDYSTFAFIPLSFFACYVVTKLLEQNQDFTKWTGRFVLFIGVVWGALFAVFEILHIYKEFILSAGFIKNLYIINIISADVSISNAILIIGLVYIAGMLTLFMLGRFSFFKKITGILTLTILLNYAIYVFIIPPIERYMQNSLIGFCKEKANEDCFILPVGFLSYAHLFYGNKELQVNLKDLTDKDQSESSFNKTIYVIYKSGTKAELLDKLGNPEIIGEENGYIFAIKK
jgi:4-amino-4-deoxy-L-arabinose transferase-like glycosyltransferase